MEFNVFRLLQRYALLCLLVMPVKSWSLGLGDVTVESLLNYPLRAKIELLVVRSEELASLSIKLASTQDFDWIGIERPEILNQLEFSSPIRDGDSTYILVTTKVPVREPVLNFLVEAQWAAGRLLREYTIKLELAAVSTIQRSEKSAAQPLEQAAKLKPAPKTNDTYTRPIEDIAQYIPKDNAVVDSIDVEGTQKSAGQHAYRSVPGDTLSGIASKFLSKTLADNKMNRLRMMIAILEANPDAFIDNNINGLKSNVSLLIPAVDHVEQLNQEQVIAEVMRQNEQWRNKSRRPTSHLAKTKDTKPIIESQEPVKTPPMTESETAQETLKAPVPKASETTKSLPEDEKSGTASVLTKQNTDVDQQSEDRARLSIVSEQQSPVEKGSFTIASSEYIANLERSVTLAQELAESRRLESNEIKSRVGRLESVIAQQERLINLQNDQLAELNDRLRILSQPKEIPSSNNWPWILGGVIAVLVLLVFYFLYRYIGRMKASANL